MCGLNNQVSLQSSLASAVGTLIHDERKLAFAEREDFNNSHCHEIGGILFDWTKGNSDTQTQ